jgi:uracil-DNA glycosylase
METKTINTTAKNPITDPGWQQLLSPLFAETYMDKLRLFLINEKQSGSEIYPKNQDIFNAFNTTPFDTVKIVILGQDPYHDTNQAHGLCFSVQDGIKPPPSLVNIYKEISQDLKNFTVPCHGNLTKWAKQGILLLNTVLTVRAHQAMSHRNQGWEIFTDNVIKILSAKKKEQNQKIIFVLWGSPAKAKIQLIDTNYHIILTAAHPSPLSAYRGFFGCKHFSKINELLIADNKPPIDWQV